MRNLKGPISQHVRQVRTGFHGVPDDVVEAAAGFRAVCIFVNKKLEKKHIESLKASGSKLILCCSAGFDNVPIDACRHVALTDVTFGTVQRVHIGRPASAWRECPPTRRRR